MAYAFNYTVRVVGAGEVEIVVSETDCGPADEALIMSPDLLVVGVVVRQMCILASGSGTVVVPILGTQPNPAGTQYVVCEESLPGKTIVDNNGRATYDLVNTNPNRLYHRSRPDVGADNVITSVYHVRPRW